MGRAVYEAGHIKRKRSTKTEMAERYEALIEIVAAAAPTGVRFCYYRAVSQGIVPKTQNGYVLVQRALMHLRETGDIPWTSITDSSRWMRKPETWDGVDELLADARQQLPPTAVERRRRPRRGLVRIRVRRRRHRGP